MSPPEKKKVTWAALGAQQLSQKGRVGLALGGSHSSVLKPEASFLNCVYFYFLGMGVSLLGMSVLHVHVVLMEARRGRQILRNWSYRRRCPNLGLLCEQQVPLTDELSQQLPGDLF